MLIAAIPYPRSMQNINSLTFWYRWFCSTSSYSSVSLCTAVISYFPCSIYMKIRTFFKQALCAATPLCLVHPSHNDSLLPNLYLVPIHAIIYAFSKSWHVHTPCTHPCTYTCAQWHTSTYTINIICMCPLVAKMFVQNTFIDGCWLISHEHDLHACVRIWTIIR